LFYGFFSYIAPEQLSVKYGGLSKDGEFGITDAVTEITVRPAAKHTVEFPVTEVNLVAFFFTFLCFVRIDWFFRLSIQGNVALDCVIFPRIPLVFIFIFVLFLFCLFTLFYATICALPMP
jgi:hypothetical protein